MSAAADSPAAAIGPREDDADAATAVFVSLRMNGDLDAARLRELAQRYRSIFAGLPGLRGKAFTALHGDAEAVNVYLWRSEDEARSFFSPACLEAVAGAYGVPPRLTYARVLALVDNAPGAKPQGPAGATRGG